MAIDEVLLHRPGNSPPVLRLYTWHHPTLTVGMAQPVERHVNLDYCRDHKIPVIRRITGGKAVLHASELTYSISGSTSDFPFGLSLLDCYKEIGNAFCKACRALGIQADMAPRETRGSAGSLTSCFACSSAFEILVDGKKLIGSAQKRTRDRVLQQGSLLLDYRAEDWGAVMRRQTEASFERVASVRMLLGEEWSLDRLQEEIINAFEEHFHVRFEVDGLTEPERKLANTLADGTYRDYTVLLDRKAP